MNTTEEDPILDMGNTQFGEMLERIYIEQIRIKANLKVLSQQISFSKLSTKNDSENQSKMESLQWKTKYEELVMKKNSREHDENQQIPQDQVLSQTAAMVIQDHSALQEAIRRLVQMLEDMRDNRDLFVETYSTLQTRLEQLEVNATVFCEHMELSRNRTRSGSFTQTMPVTKQEITSAEKRKQGDA